jgi:hypothetical protein
MAAYPKFHGDTDRWRVRARFESSRPNSTVLLVSEFVISSFAPMTLVIRFAVASTF